MNFPVNYHLFGVHSDCDLGVYVSPLEHVWRPHLDDFGRGQRFQIVPLDGLLLRMMKHFLGMNKEKDNNRLFFSDEMWSKS